MELIDVFIGLILLYELLRGLKRGFVAEAGSIVALVAGFYIASAMRGKMAQFLSPVCFNSEGWSSALGFLFTFLVVYALITILAKVFEGFLGVVALGGINRLAGGFFCLMKGILVLSIVLNLYETIDQDRSFVGIKHIESSAFYKPVVKVAPALFPYFSSGKAHQYFRKPELNHSQKTTL